MWYFNTNEKHPFASDAQLDICTCDLRRESTAGKLSWLGGEPHRASRAGESVFSEEWICLGHLLLLFTGSLHAGLAHSFHQSHLLPQLLSASLITSSLETPENSVCVLGGACRGSYVFKCVNHAHSLLARGGHWPFLSYSLEPETLIEPRAMLVASIAL